MYFILAFYVIGCLAAYVALVEDLARYREVWGDALLAGRTRMDSMLVGLPYHLALSELYEKWFVLRYLGHDRLPSLRKVRKLVMLECLIILVWPAYVIKSMLKNINNA